jgi:hypothetical protein
MRNINNGDVYDIGQTVNGVSRFVWLNDKWYYFEQRFFSEYQYDNDDLTKLIIDDDLSGFDETKYLGNIFDNI